MNKKQWIVQNNVLGTAYVNRFKKVDDFKPGTLMKPNHSKTNVYMMDAEFKLTPLKLPFEILDGYVDVNDPKQQDNLAGFVNLILIKFENHFLEYTLTRDFGMKMKVSEDIKNILRQKKAERLKN